MAENNQNGIPEDSDQHTIRQVLDSVTDATLPMEERIPFWSEIRKLLVLNRIARLVSASLDLRAILNEVARLTVETMRVRVCSVFLREKNRFVLRALVGMKNQGIGKMAFRPGQGISGWVAENRQPVAVSQVTKDPRHQNSPWPPEQAYPSLLSVPLLMGNTLVGIINVQDDQERTFSYQEIGLLTNLAGHVVGAIRNAQLYEEAHGRLHELESLHEMGQTISSTLDLSDLLKRMCRLSTESVKADGSIARIWNLERKTLDVNSSFERRARIKDLFGVEGKLAQDAFDRQEPILKTVDLSRDRKRKKYAAFLCVPIASHRSRVGVLSLFRIRGSRTLFSTSDIRLVESLVSQAGIAIHNAELFSQAKHTENALREAQAELFRKQKLAALGTVAAGLAHELRNPLVSIGGFADRIKRNAKDPTRVERYADICISEVRRLERLIRETLVYASPETPRRRKVNLRKMLTEVCLVVREHESARMIRIKRNIQEGAEELLADPETLKRAFLNVLFNAAEIMKGKGTIEVVAHRPSDEEFIEVEVRDEGPGIDPRDLTRIFEPFVSGKEGGTGLGLAIASHVAELHGGTLRAHNRPNGGATFVFRLPLAGKPDFRTEAATRPEPEP